MVALGSTAIPLQLYKALNSKKPSFCGASFLPESFAEQLAQLTPFGKSFGCSATGDRDSKEEAQVDDSCQSQSQ